MKGSDFISEAKFYSNILLIKLNDCNSLSEQIDVLKSKIEQNIFLNQSSKNSGRSNSKNSKKLSNKSTNQTLKQKLFAFFKKI